MKNKIYNIILLVLVSILIIVTILIVLKYIKNQVKEKELTEVITQVTNEFDKIEEDESEIKNEVQVEYNGYKVVGIVKIPKIDIEYPIIDKTNDQSMKVSITKFWGNNVNDKGNFTMVGHNYIDGTMFGKTKKLEIGDTIEMTDLFGKTIEYKVFSKYVIDPNDVSCVNSIESGTREITLITCTNGKSNRLIIKAREII